MEIHKSGTWQQSKISTLSCWWMDIQSFSIRNSNFNLNYSALCLGSLILPLTWDTVGLGSAVLLKQGLEDLAANIGRIQA